MVCHPFRLDAEANWLSSKRITPDTGTHAISEDTDKRCAPVLTGEPWYRTRADSLKSGKLTSLTGSREKSHEC